MRISITSDLCVGSFFNYSAVQNSHRRGVGPPQLDFGPHWLRGAACGWAEGSLPRPPPPASLPWRRPQGTRTCCAECSKLGSWWAPHPVHSRSSCSDTASVPSVSVASHQARGALCWFAGYRAAAAPSVLSGLPSCPSPQDKPSLASSEEGSRPLPVAHTYTQQMVFSQLQHTLKDLTS